MKYLIPHDFSGVGDVAVHFAIDTAKHTGAGLILLHIVKNKAEKQPAEEKLKATAEKITKETGFSKIESIVKEGSIFEDIGRTAKEEKCRLVVMGTHGSKGMQKVFGSYAIKVITNASVPFMIVQDVNPDAKIKNIVQPIDLTMESMQVSKFAAETALRFDAKVHIVTHSVTDAALKRKMKIHFKVLEKQFEEFGIDYEMKPIDDNSKLHNLVVNYAKEIDADMLAIAYHTESILPQFDRFAQSILTNELKLPVLIVNSKQVSSMYF